MKLGKITILMALVLLVEGINLQAGVPMERRSDLPDGDYLNDDRASSCESFIRSEGSETNHFVRCYYADPFHGFNPTNITNDLKFKVESSDPARQMTCNNIQYIGYQLTCVSTPITSPQLTAAQREQLVQRIAEERAFLAPLSNQNISRPVMIIPK